VEPEPAWSLEALVADTRVRVRHLEDEMTAVRQDLRRLDDRLFNVVLLQFATLAGTLASILAALLR
jgi:hypothetical protein